MLLFPLPEVVHHSVVLAALAGTCPEIPPPEVSVRTVRHETIVNNTLSQQELENFKTDTDLPLQMQNMAHVETGGFMRGDITIGYKINMDTMPVDSGDGVCVRYQAIDVTLEMKPEIYIARQYQPDSCWYHEIMQHEESHIDMDQVVIDKYAHRVKDGLSMAFSMQGDNMFGPVPAAQVDEVKKTIGKNVVSMVTILTQDMMRERIEKQRVVDSLQGYAYLMNSCYTGEGPVIYVSP